MQNRSYRIMFGVTVQVEKLLDVGVIGPYALCAVQDAIDLHKIRAKTNSWVIFFSLQFDVPRAFDSPTF